VKDPEHGRALAGVISAKLREATASHSAELHLFVAAPLPLVILIGHRWNRMPLTQLYDLGPGKGYTPTFTLPA
jgi:hypothetical protein